MKDLNSSWNISTGDHLDSLDAAQVTVGDLVQMMETFLEDSDCEAYSPTYMKSKLIEHYDDEIVFAQSNKKAVVSSQKKKKR